MGCGCGKPSFSRPNALGPQNVPQSIVTVAKGVSLGKQPPKSVVQRPQV